MSYDALVFNVMIASPNDVISERNITNEVIHDWNAVHSYTRKIILLPINWKTHSSPEMGGTAQDIINKQVLDKCDLLVGIFWTRIGTSTNSYISGTVEEIEKHVKADKPAMLYFSNQPVHPDSVDDTQFKKLRKFKEACKTKGLLETYDSLSDFKDKFYRQLQLKINEHSYFVVNNAESANQTIVNTESASTYKLSNEAQALLKEASLDSQGIILHLRHFGGTDVQTNGHNLITNNEHREVAKWEAALNELLSVELIQDRGRKGEVYEITDQGYKVADSIQLLPEPPAS